MAELSIIVPVYKVEKYLPKCIDSILAQTFRDFELILIDDGSPDNCGAICDAYAARDSRIKVIHQANAGLSAARNAGLDISTGTYLGFVDSDDWIEPEMYETMIATAMEKNVDVVVCGVQYCAEDGALIRTDLLSEDTYNRDGLLSAFFGMPAPLGGTCWNKIFRTTRVNEIRFAEDISICEDSIYLFECFRRCEEGAKIPDTLYHYTQREDSTTRERNLELIFQPFVQAKMELIRMAGTESAELEGKAIDKYLDDCLRYIPYMCEVGKAGSLPYQKKLFTVKRIMLSLISNAYLRKLMPRAKLNGYLVGMIRMK